MTVEHVRLVEVGPRDGLQNEKAPVSTTQKIQLINALSAAGFAAVEAGSFVSPKWVPRMADSGEVFRGIEKRTGTAYPVLTPNMRGLEDAIDAGAREIAVFGAASESFSNRNINCGIEESLKRFEPVAARATASGLAVRGYISCVLGCPYEGRVEPEAVRAVAEALMAMGCYEVSLGDTIGVGTPPETRALVETVAKTISLEHIAGHFHDTYGQALANIWAAIDLGVAVFDCSVAGLGGCPYAKGASGNVASEDVVYSLERGGIQTGVDLSSLIETGAWISGVIGRPTQSRVANAARSR